MNRRRITRTLGAATGGLLGATFLAVAVAFADHYDIVPDPASTEQITGIYGSEYGLGGSTASPAVAGSIPGVQLFDFDDTTTGTSGTFDADESTTVDHFGDTNQEVLVTSDVSGTDAPPVGSVFDTYTLGDGNFENIYFDSPSPSGDVISDTVVTPLGHFTIPVPFDAAGVRVADAEGVALGDGYDFVPGSASTVTAITGIPPLTVAIQGDQLFDVDDTTGNVVGTFNGDETTTADGFGTYTEAVLVTSDGKGTDLPPVGSVFNTINFYGIENIYSDDPSPSGDRISDTMVTPLGRFTIPVPFDAAAAAHPVTIDLPDGYAIVPDPTSTEVFTGINGLPPASVGILGDQLFDLDNAGGTAVGTFDADETTTSDIFGDSTQTLLVTSDQSGTSGTAAGDVPPVGSEIETVTLGDTGFGYIFSDLALPSGDMISRTLVTPIGDVTLPAAFGAAAGLAADTFLILP